MPHTNRREFLAQVAGAGTMLALAPRVARAADSRVEILLDEPIGTIAPEIYGHFAEHLGGVVYDGIWVSEGSAIPNQGGIRTALVEHLRRINAPVVRWPGGCFADSYDWRDGIGPRADRPRRTNFWLNTRVPPGPQQYDPNHFGTLEFVRFCQLSGAQPYLAANVRSLPARDFYQWVEYCNSPAGTTTMAGIRAAQGAPQPLDVRYWGVGNEPWGCGGDFSPEDYAAAFRRYTSWVPGYDVDLRFIGAGPSGPDFDWTRRFFAKLTEESRGLVNRLWGWSFHHYSTNVSGGRSDDWNESKGPAVGFTTEQYYELLREGDRMDAFITGHWQALAEFDPEHRVTLAVDEWGSWHRPGTQADPTHTLGQISTIRDALLAGLTLDIFHRHCEKVSMANIAQLVNCLQSLFVAAEDRFIVTPNYHVFDMYQDHMGAEALRTVVSAPGVSYERNGRPATLWGLNGSASRKDGAITLTLVNPSLDQPREVDVVIRGARAAGLSTRTLAAATPEAHNSFAQPEAVPSPRETPGALTGSSLILTCPPASVVRARITLT